MSLCITCSSIPFRALARGDYPPDWKKSSWTDNNGIPWGYDSETWICDRRQTTLPLLRESAIDCIVCSMLMQGVETRSVYKRVAQEVDMEVAPAWLHLSESETYGTKLDLYLDKGINEVTAVEFRNRFDTPSPNVFKPVKIEDSLDPTPVKQFRAWFDECNLRHERCAAIQQDSLLPTRVLDLDDMPSSDALAVNMKQWPSLFSRTECKLVETTSGQKGKYATLSYCWGNGLPFMTTTDTLSMRKSSIGFQDLPKTLQDAAMVVRSLGLRYVWIDCLAIVQDDTADWEKESAVMADIYSRSYINIAASNASHCGAGFLGPRKMPLTERIEIHDSEGDLELYLVAQQTRNYALPSDPLETRAWVLQEQLLPSRSLHFGSANMFWRCPDGISHEEQRRGWTHLYTLDAVVYSINLPIGAAIGQDAWFQLVRDYTARGITYPKDKFPAISGVMTVLQRMTGDVCAAGLWKRNFAKWLLWVPRHDVAPFKRSDIWTAPSWSFMSGEGPVDYGLGDLTVGMNTSLRGFCAVLEECRVVPKGLNPLGELKDGWARISGPVTDVTAIGRHAATGKSPYRSCRVQMRDQRYQAHARVIFDIEAYETCEVLIVAPALGVAIVCKDVARGEYVRVGLVVIKREKIDMMNGSKEWWPGVEDHSKPRSIVLR